MILESARTPSTKAMAEALEKSKARRYCLTIHLGTLEKLMRTGKFDRDWDPEDFWGNEHILFFIGQLELCETTGQVHWQTYVELDAPYTGKWLLKRMKVKGFAWFRPTLGTQAKNIVYCSKEESKLGDTITLGKKCDQGSREDLYELREMIKSGEPVEKIVDRCFVSYLRYHGGIDKAIKHLKPKNSRPPPRKMNVILNWGVTGAGKSHEAYNCGRDYYDKNLSTTGAKYWDDYAGEEVLIIDDFSGQIDIDTFKRVLDKNPWDIGIMMR